MWTLHPYNIDLVFTNEGTCIKFLVDFELSLKMSHLFFFFAEKFLLEYSATKKLQFTLKFLSIYWVGGSDKRAFCRKQKSFNDPLSVLLNLIWGAKQMFKK